jgi:hypothetical protein
MKKEKKFRPFVSHSAVDGLSVILVMILTAFSAWTLPVTALGLPLGVLCVVAIIIGLFLRRLYLMWQTIAEFPGRTASKKAVVYMLIPVFNFYWAFVAVKGLSDDINTLLQKKGLIEKRISESLSIAFSVIFPLTFLSLFYPDGQILFFALFLSMLFIMRRLIWQWREAEQCLKQNTEEAAQSVEIVDHGKIKNIIKATGIVVGTVAVSLFIVVWYVSAMIVPYAGYRDKAHTYALKADLKNAHTAAVAYLMDYPKSIVASEEHLKSRGWAKSHMNIFISANMTAEKGEIILKNKFLEKQKKFAPGIGKIDSKGTVVLPSMTE